MEEFELTLDDERRRRPRPLALPPSLSLKLDIVVKPIMRGLTHPLRGLILLITLTIVSTVWVFWTIDHRMGPLHTYQEAVRNEFSLTQEIADLEAAHYEETINQLENSLANAAKRILPDYQALAAWIHARSVDATAAGLKLEYQISEPREVDNLPAVWRVPLAIVLKINVQNADNDGYQRLLDYLYYLDQETWTKEIRRAAMTAENGSARVLEVTIDLWMHDDPESFRAIEQQEIEIEVAEMISGDAFSR